MQTKSLIEPEGPSALVPLLRSTVVRSMVQNAATKLAQAAEPAVIKPLPGWVLAPFVQDHAGERRSLSLALVLLDSVCDSAQFAIACASAKLDVSRVKTVCVPLLRHGQSDLDNTLNVLNWMHEDLVRNHHLQEAVRQAHQRRACHSRKSAALAEALVAAIEAKDPFARGHAQRVSLLASMMAEALRLDDRQVENYRLAGLVHDIGKIAVPESVLTKSARLSASEITLVQRHAETGYTMLRHVPGLDEALPGVLHHHERYDGFGYPAGLAGEKVPLVARVIALADAFDAMSSTRSYREALTRENVFEEIRRCAGTHFDPNLVEVFLKMDFSGFDALMGVQQRARQAA
ncbi:MAG TPA: HD-GYP domain-containing protein [Tepidisphaeraceae bacterium]